MSERQHEKVLKAFRPLVEATARRYEGKGALYEDLVQEGYLAVLDLYPRCSDKDYLVFCKPEFPTCAKLFPQCRVGNFHA